MTSMDKRAPIRNTNPIGAACPQEQTPLNLEMTRRMAIRLNRCSKEGARTLRELPRIRRRCTKCIRGPEDRGEELLRRIKQRLLRAMVEVDSPCL